MSSLFGFSGTFPTLSMAATEFKLILRRPGTASIVLLLPAVLIGLTYIGERPDSAARWGATIGTHVVIALLLTVYVNAAVLMTNRRENLIFKRLRTSELGGTGIMLSICIPFVLLSMFQIVLVGGFNLATGATVPQVPDLIGVAVGLGIVATLAASAMTAALTGTTERVQFTTMPILLGGAVGAQIVTADLDMNLRWAALVLPLVALADLIAKGWAGMDSGITTLPANIEVSVVTVDIALTAGWCLLAIAVAVARWRWEPRS
ncbi:ABC transporter permease [Nocardia sp. CA-290969]|uniref:ABC transporter permease n=1 Tax=Nocardia sp. CA-290969 TaxID=3239986 RepID=UPI003D8F1752